MSVCDGLRVAIIHYHLRPGGVTSVIRSTCEALAQSEIRYVVLTGDAACYATHPAVREIHGLDYLADRGSLTSASVLENLRTAAASALGGPPDIWHFHNHSLGKNCLVPEIVSLLAAAGERLVLQIHDLAEDGRAENYSLIAGQRGLYPTSSTIHYAFLARRDLEIFASAGLPAERGSLLPNPVPTRTEILPPASDSRGPAILFAPIRGIRRKNLGELVLLAALSPPHCAVAVSRAPTNPAALSIHNTWQKFAHSHGFRIEFDVVDRFAPSADSKSDFDTWVAASTHYLTTSVAEGFGMSFLEAAAAGKPLLGRDLPTLTNEMGEHGIRPGRLYQRILIPTSWITIPVLRDYFITAMERTFRGYQRPLPGREAAAAFEDFAQRGLIDFGNLPEPLQQAIIEKSAEQQNRATPLVEVDGETEPLETWLGRTIAERTPTVHPAQLAPYSLEAYQTRLSQLYCDLAATPAGPLADLAPDRILAAYLTPKNFHFLRSIPPAYRPTKKSFRAVIFDIYGTLLTGRPAGVRHDPAMDKVLRQLLHTGGYRVLESPTAELHAAVLRQHALAGYDYPEVDLRDLWREILHLGPADDVQALLEATEAAWHPTERIPGAEDFIQKLARSGVSLGLLSNAQAHTLTSLGGLADLFPPELTILSYQHGLAKPSPDLFRLLSDRLSGRGIKPGETLFVGNDPLHDITPAAAAGFKTALFTGHPDSHRPGDCEPDYIFESWENLYHRL